ncbi:hypothetical protein [Bradyrhizobium sp. ISRA463]|uniref:hypothetical protein n=1 Tax=Bradyrhizobium sp. ISRA463 TaxID=2866199 RepID=UPI0024799BEB|nr:hypothetical protein [Bradyrhizobium sp. ISRA463]WGS19191.1 hypothetical protein MTX22_32875 [Bradyrhizobium sp. ISRA463]
MSSAIRWVTQARETGEVTPKPQGGDRRSQAIEAQPERILALIAAEPDSTLEELKAALPPMDIRSAPPRCLASSSVARSRSKKAAHAAEQERPEVLKRREEWGDGQIGLDPDKLIFIEESVLQTAEEVQHELRAVVKLRERWGQALRDRLSGAGLKPVRAAAVRSRGGEHRIKSSDQTEQVSVRKTNESEPSEDASL